MFKFTNQLKQTKNDRTYQNSIGIKSTEKSI